MPQTDFSKYIKMQDKTAIDKAMLRAEVTTLSLLFSSLFASYFDTSLAVVRGSPLDISVINIASTELAI